MAFLKKIIRGGQTGVDTAALRLGISMGIPHGGWCPRGRKREDGVIPSRFRLQETSSSGYLERTRLNVKQSDGTVIFSIGERLRGSGRTAQFARKLRKPFLHLSARQLGADHRATLRRFIRQHQIRVINIAGSRKSQEPAAG